MSGLVERLRAVMNANTLRRNDDGLTIWLLESDLVEAADTIESLIAALNELYCKTVIGTDAERHAALDKAGTLLATLDQST